MTFKEFDEYQATLMKKANHLMNTKGREYTDDKDRFDNFNQEARDLNINRLIVAEIFLDKHIRAIKSFIRNKKEISDEKIQDRIIDAINYLKLIGGMIHEENMIIEKTIERMDNITEPYNESIVDKIEKRIKDAGDNLIKDLDKLDKKCIFCGKLVNFTNSPIIFSDNTVAHKLCYDQNLVPVQKATLGKPDRKCRYCAESVNMLNSFITLYGDTIAHISCYDKNLDRGKANLNKTS